MQSKAELVKLAEEDDVMALASDKLHALAEDPKVRVLAKKCEQDRILYEMSLRVAAQ